MDLGGVNWAILNIVGPLLLLIVIAWALLRNRKSRTREKIDRSERATHELYDQEEAQRRREDEQS